MKKYKAEHTKSPPCVKGERKSPIFKGDCLYIFCFIVFCFSGRSLPVKLTFYHPPFFAREGLSLSVSYADTSPSGRGDNPSLKAYAFFPPLLRAGFCVFSKIKNCDVTNTAYFYTSIHFIYAQDKFS